MTKTPLKTPKTPLPDTIAHRVHAVADRLGLSDEALAHYLGAPVFTVRKWRSGEREPGAVVAHLLDVLGTLEAIAPQIHDSFLPSKASNGTCRKAPTPSP